MLERPRHQDFNEATGTLGPRFILYPILLAFFIAAVLVFNAAAAYSWDGRVLIREDFDNLQNWRPLYFPKIPAHTTYTIGTKEDGGFLVAQSAGSASALVYKEYFNVYEYPRVRWRWKVSNVYGNANPQKKSGDDYAIRVYVLFTYDPQTAGVMDRLKYGVARKLYGEYPPHSTLNYVWANNKGQQRVITSPYTDRAKLIALEEGTEKAGTWQYEEVDILHDYRAAFGTDPPPVASIAIMNDSDDTGQGSVSYVDFIEVFKDGD